MHGQNHIKFIICVDFWNKLLCPFTSLRYRFKCTIYFIRLFISSSPSHILLLHNNPHRSCQIKTQKKHKHVSKHLQCTRTPDVFHVSFILKAFSFSWRTKGVRKVDMILEPKTFRQLPLPAQKLFSSHFFSFFLPPKLRPLFLTPPNPTTSLSDLTEVARNTPSLTTPQSKTKNQLQIQPINHTFTFHIQLRLDVRESRFTKFRTFVIAYFKIIVCTCRDWFRRIGMRRRASGSKPPPLSFYTVNRSQLIQGESSTK